MLKNKILMMLVLTLLCFFIISTSTAGINSNPKIDDHTAKNKINPKMESRLLEENQGQAGTFLAQFQNQSTRKVVFELKDSDKSYIKSLEDSGASIEAINKNLLQASVPVSQLRAMSDLPFVNYVRSPRRPFKDVISQGVEVINSTPLNNIGIRGKGVKIAILDVGFTGYQSKLGTELPASVTAISYRSDGDISGGGENHGTGVAEIVYDIAPDAQMYLINFETELEFANAVDYAISQNVDIVSMSLGWLEGPFDGTSFISARVNSAVSNGIVWVNSAGNYAQRHWEGGFSDPDGNGINNFPTGDENMRFDLPSGGNIAIVLSWNDSNPPNQDYDLYLYDSTGVLIAQSTNPQNGGGGQTPVESISTPLGPGTYNLQIWKDNSTGEAKFELYSAYQELESQYRITSSSLAVPGDAQGAITVGATTLADLLEPFSSQGPTNDGRTKPDLVAPDGVSTLTYGSNNFYGTSASAPHIAGAAALLKSINSSLTPAAIRSALQDTAKTLGDPNSFGSGKIDAWEAAKKVDKKNPEITITFPNESKKLNSSSITVSGIASDNAGVSTVEVKVGAGSWQTASGTTSWSAPIILSDGLNPIFAQATDIAGNVQETSVNVTSDTTPPTITFTSPPNAQKLNASVITVTGTASDNDLSKVEVKVGNKEWQTAQGTTSWSTSLNLTQGLNMISARATDNAGNTQETSINVTSDTTLPTITFTSHSNAQKLNASVITVAGTASDNDLSKVEVRVGNENWQTAQGTTSWNASVTLMQGLNIISARATDNAGNTQETQVIVILDTAGPIIAIISPEEGDYLNTSIITITGIATDDNLSKVEVRIENGTWQTALGKMNWSKSVKLSEGPNKISARAMDLAKNIQETSVNVTLDTKSPGINITSLADNQYLNKSVITITGMATDNNLNKVEVKTGNGTWQTAQGTAPWSASVTLSEGSNTISARASDIAGNFNETAVNVILDTIKPEVTNLTVLPSMLVVNEPVDIKVAVRDEHLNASSIFALVESPYGDSSKCQMIGSGIYSCRFTNTSRYGRYNVTIVADDLAGNINNTGKTWFVTTMKPYENNSVNTVGNNVTEINALNEVNTTLELVTSGNVSNGAIKITMSSDIPPEINRATGLVPFGKYISINSSNNVLNNLNWIKINIYYTEGELRASGLDENSLRISYYNESNKMWEILSKASQSWVNDAGAATANTNNFSGFVFVNVSHLSTFALVGNYPIPPQSNRQGSRPSGGGGGGGGGGGTSDESFSNVELKEKYYLHIFKDKVTTYRFTSEKNPIQFINITGNINAGEINIAVEVLRNTSSIVKIPPPGTVYKNVNIWVGTSGFAVPRNINNAVIRFRIPNAWLESNSITSSEIKMVRWEGSKWITLDTRVKEKDGANTYFEATTNAFSPFAATGLKEDKSNDSYRWNVLQPEPTETKGTTSMALGIAPPIDFIIILGILILFILIVIVQFFKGDGYNRR